MRNPRCERVVVVPVTFWALLAGLTLLLAAFFPRPASEVEAEDDEFSSVSDAPVILAHYPSTSAEAPRATDSQQFERYLRWLQHIEAERGRRAALQRKGMQRAPEQEQEDARRFAIILRTTHLEPPPDCLLLDRCYMAALEAEPGDGKAVQEQLEAAAGELRLAFALRGLKPTLTLVR